MPSPVLAVHRVRVWPPAPVQAVPCLMPHPAGPAAIHGRTARAASPVLTRCRVPRRLAEACQQFAAGLLAVAARLCADAAVLMHFGVAFALVGAGLAGGLACLQDGPGDVGVIPGVPGQDVS